MADKKDPRQDRTPASLQMAGHDRIRITQEEPLVVHPQDEDPTDVPVVDQQRVLEFSNDAQSQLEAVERWFRTNDAPNPKGALASDQTIDNVLEVLNLMFPGAKRSDLGRINCVLFGEATSRDNLVAAMNELAVCHRVRKLHGLAPGATLGPGEQELMTRFWDNLPEVCRPDEGLIYYSWNAAFAAVLSAFPNLEKNHRYMISAIALALYGAVPESKFELFLDNIETARLTDDAVGNLELDEHAVTLTDGDDMDELRSDEHIVIAMPAREGEALEDITVEQEIDGSPFIEEQDADPEFPLFSLDKQERDEPAGPRWVIGVILLVLIVLALGFAWWRLDGLWSFSEMILAGESYDTHAPDAQVEQGLAPPPELLLQPDPQVIATIPLPCTSYQMLHTPNLGPAPEGCYVVGCSEGYPALRSYTPETGWLECTTDQVIPKRGECYLITNKDRSARSVAFLEDEWVDKECL